jgi:hypothetical protein
MYCADLMVHRAGSRAGWREKITDDDGRKIPSLRLPDSAYGYRFKKITGRIQEDMVDPDYGARDPLPRVSGAF